MRRAEIILAAAWLACGFPANASEDRPHPADANLAAAAGQAQRQLRQTFTNLEFEDFGRAPVNGPLYQANAGGRIIYYAPESEHLLFATVYDRNGVNVTALAQEAIARKRLAGIDTSQALVIGPQDAPEVIEFTDPDCPYCRALDRFWAAKAAEGKPVRRLIFFVSGIHPQAAAKAEHIQRGAGSAEGRRGGRSISGGADGRVGFVSSDRGSTSESAGATLDIVNYDVRSAIASAEKSAARSNNPEHEFTRTLSDHLLGDDGLRNRYLRQADAARGTADVTGPLTSIEQSSVLHSGRFSNDLANGPFDGDSSFKERGDK